jgi:hypothetical protein
MMRRTSITPRDGTPSHRTWRRRQPRQPWARRDIVTIAGVMLATIPSLSRAELARLTTRMIDRMDEIDGDPELEDDDPAGGSADDIGEIEPWQADRISLALPRYGKDQSNGPINVHAAAREYQRVWDATYLDPR